MLNLSLIISLSFFASPHELTMIIVSLLNLGAILIASANAWLGSRLGFKFSYLVTITCASRASSSVEGGINTGSAAGIRGVPTVIRLQEIKSGKLKDLVKNNKLIVDGSHNEDGARVLNEYLQTLNCNKHIIVGMMTNKEHEKYISYFKDISSITTIDLVQLMVFGVNSLIMTKDMLN